MQPPRSRNLTVSSRVEAATKPPIVRKAKAVGLALTSMPVGTDDDELTVATNIGQLGTKTGASVEVLAERAIGKA